MTMQPNPGHYVWTNRFMDYVRDHWHSIIVGAVLAGGTVWLFVPPKVVIRRVEITKRVEVPVYVPQTAPVPAATTATVPATSKRAATKIQCLEIPKRVWDSLTGCLNVRDVPDNWCDTNYVFDNGHCIPTHRRPISPQCKVYEPEQNFCIQYTNETRMTCPDNMYPYENRCLFK